MSFNMTKQVSACSCTLMTGWNRIYGRGVPDGAPPGITSLDMATLSAIGKAINGLEQGGWKGAGPEMVVGMECNSRNRNQAAHHSYDSHTGHLFKRHIEQLGLGKVHLSRWSSGDGDTGSQIRTVTWHPPLYRAALRRLSKLKQEAKLKDADPLLKLQVDTIENSRERAARW